MDGFQRGGLTFDVLAGGPPDGAAVVLLHGFPQDATAWDGVAPALHARGCRTLAPHQRGYSPRARPRGRSAYRMRELTDDVLALLDAAGLGRAHVVGHDWGAAVGWALAAWHPDRVRTLTALSVPHVQAMTRAMLIGDQALQSYYMALYQLPWLPERLMLARDGEPLRRGLLRGGLPVAAVDRYVHRMSEPGALTAALNWYRAIPASARDRVGRIAVPTRMVWSTGDRYLGRTAVEASARYVDGPYRLDVLPDVPHWIPECAPEQVAGIVTEHVAAHPG